MKKPFTKAMATLSILSSTLVIATLTVCFVIFFSVFHLKTYEKHISNFRELVYQEKQTLLKNTVYRTINDIEQEQASCATFLQRLDQPEQSKIQWYCSEAEIKERIKNTIRNKVLGHQEYIWVNKIINYNGGDNYAIRLVHPNLIETEGAFLSTKAQDIKGNTPYLTELNGVKKDGELFFEYWFKKINNDEIAPKLTFAKLYKKYDWVIATGIYLDDLDAAISEQQAETRQLLIHNLIVITAMGTLLALVAFFIAFFFHKKIQKTLHLYAQEVKEKENDIKGMNITLEKRVEERTLQIKQSERRLKASEKKFQDLFDNAPDMYVTVDKETSLVLECNLTLCRVLGYSKEEIIGSPVFNLYHQDSLTAAQKTLKIFRETGEVHNHVLQLARKDGQKLEVTLNASAVRDVDGNILNSRSVWRDRTDLKRIESQLQHAQKMEAIGTLAGGIAHDFNNILGVIIGYAELAKDESQPDSIIAEDLEAVIDSADRAKQLVQQILSFSRQAENERCLLNPAHLVQEAIKMLRPILPATISIEQSIDLQVGCIMIDPVKIHQVLMNLCTNAFHAMEKSGGLLGIRLSKQSLSSKDLTDQPGLKPGKYVQLSISDTGPGIPLEIQNKIFDPYFTTKEVGKGTGMGLSIAHGIVNSSGGFIELNSHEGKGATFNIYFPIVDQEQKTIKTVLPVQGGTERILLVDDERVLAKMSKDMLERLGYNVTVQNNSLQALKIFQHQPQAFDLVITDQTMPNMTGVDLAKQMLRIRPDTSIILCTGYSSILSKEKAMSYGIKAFATKPLTKKELDKLIREVLDTK